ncbi:MAG TPA: metallophosphoesterase family protein [Anaeromyxobacteraceae bacterium]|nr:metallophosphoesterase family protein [Anaeromyxobacteraceae bacterium]
MKLALLADLHANLEGATACLEHAREQGAEAFAFLGDLVGYGADPEAVLDLVAAEAAAGAVVVRGNHDAAVLAAGADTMNRAAEAALDWTRARLSERHRAFLAGLPLEARQGEVHFVHASADRPADWTYVCDPLRAEQSLVAAGATWVFSGHVHEPMLYYLGSTPRPLGFKPVPGVAIPVPAHRRWLAIVGSAGQPRDGNTAACYALLDRARSTLTFHRVPYDWARAAAKIRAAGLPESLARRLERGE